MFSVRYAFLQELHVAKVQKLSFFYPVFVILCRQYFLYTTINYYYYYYYYNTVRDIS